MVTYPLLQIAWTTVQKHVEMEEATSQCTLKISDHIRKQEGGKTIGRAREGGGDEGSEEGKDDGEETVEKHVEKEEPRG